MTSETPAESHDVARKTRSGLSWNVLGAVGTNVTRVAVIAILGRALDSTDFGVVAAAVSVTTILHGIRDIGVGTAIVQRKELLPGHVSSGVAFSIVLGVALSMLLFLTAPLVGDLFSIPQSVDVIRGISLLFAIRGFSTIPRMLAQRAMRFRASTIAETAAFMVGSAVSIVLALGGAGPWALVAGYLVEEVLATLMFMKIEAVPLTLRIDRIRLRELLGFGSRQTAGQVMGSLGNNVDNFVVAHWLGATQLGFYTRAYDLIRLPSIAFGTIVGTVLFPAFARIKDDRARLADHYRRVAFANALVLLPASAGLIVLAPEAIRVLMGEGWEAAILPFRVLAIAMLARTSQRLSALVATAAGRAGAIAIAYTLYSAAVLVGALATVQFGIPGVAISTAIGMFVCFVACSVPALQVTGLPLTAFAMAHVPGIVLAGVVLVVGWPLAVVLRTHLDLAVGVISIVALLAGGICLGVLTAWVRLGRGDMAWLGTELARLRKRRRA